MCSSFDKKRYREFMCKASVQKAGIIPVQQNETAHHASRFAEDIQGCGHCTLLAERGALER